MELLQTGGLFFTLPILLMGISAILLFVWQFVLKIKKEEIVKKRIDLILFLGSFAFIYGIFGQVLGLYQAAGAIQQAPDISPTLIWAGVRVSMIAPIMGFCVLLISSVLWFVLKSSK